MEEIRKPIDFSQCHAGIDREAEAEILRMMDTHKDTRLDIPYSPDNNPDNLSVATRDVGIIYVTEIRYKSAEGNDYLEIIDRFGRPFVLSHLMNGEISKIYDFIWRYYDAIDSDIKNMKYHATLKWLKEMDLDKLVEWINTHLCAEILPNRNEDVWREYESRLKSMDRFVEAICDSITAGTYLLSDKYVRLSEIRFLESYNDTDKLWKEFGGEIVDFLKKQ